jgi:hypothetical protein
MNEQLLYNRANDADACLVKFTVIDPQDTNDPPPVTG